MSVLIISVSGDSSTDNVMDWISHFNHKSIRYNVDKDPLENTSSISMTYGNYENDLLINSNGEAFNSKDFEVVWFRKFFNPDLKQEISSDLSNILDSNVLIEHNKNEFYYGIHAMFSNWLVEKKVLGKRITKHPTKMEMLIGAKKMAIDIPNTLITNQKSCLENFKKVNENIITKAIKEGELFSKYDSETKKKIFACMYTELLDEKLMKKVPDRFLLSLFQEALDKEFEIRVFYLNGKTFSSAIFSQSDAQTNVDFRMYNTKKPNRTVPYKLSQELEMKVKNLMDYLGLKTGSLDFVKTKDGRTVFLEVNPWGQYGMVSGPCNYFLDKKIAEYLIELKNEKHKN